MRSLGGTTNVAGRRGAPPCAVALGVPSAGSALGSKKALETISVDTLPIANALPMDLGIQKGFFEAQGIEIKKQILQSGNDIVLALANSNGDIGYLGYVPMMIARTQGIPLQIVAASEVEGTSQADNWQNILVKGSSDIRTPKDLVGKTVAVNALKGVGETVIKAAFKKSGIDPNSVKLLAVPVPGDADGAVERAGRRDLDAGAVPLAGAEPGRRPDRDGAGPGRRQVLPERRLRGARRLGVEEPAAGGASSARP